MASPLKGSQVMVEVIDMLIAECKINCKTRLDKDILLKSFNDPHLISPEKDQAEY